MDGIGQHNGHFCGNEHDCGALGHVYPPFSTHARPAHGNKHRLVSGTRTGQAQNRAGGALPERHIGSGRPVYFVLLHLKNVAHLKIAAPVQGTSGIVNFLLLIIALPAMLEAGLNFTTESDFDEKTADFHRG